MSGKEGKTKQFSEESAHSVTRTDQKSGFRVVLSGDQ